MLMHTCFVLQGMTNHPVAVQQDEEEDSEEDSEDDSKEDSSDDEEESLESEEDAEEDVEEQDDADVRWDNAHSEWVLLPSAKCLNHASSWLRQSVQGRSADVSAYQTERRGSVGQATVHRCPSGTLRQVQVREYHDFEEYDDMSGSDTHGYE